MPYNKVHGKISTPRVKKREVQSSKYANERNTNSATRVMAYFEGPKIGYESTSTLQNLEQLTMSKKATIKKFERVNKDKTGKNKTSYTKKPVILEERNLKLMESGPKWSSIKNH